MLRRTSLFGTVLFATMGFILSLPGCTSAEPEASAEQTEPQKTRPYEPWVFRSVLDGRPRMITIALDERLWVAYDAQQCGLYRAWPGGVKLVGAVYTDAHGPQPSVDAKTIYYTQPAESPWRLLRDGEEVEAEIQYRGYRLDGTESVTLHYAIELDNRTVDIFETPRFFTDGDRVGLRQEFEIKGLGQDEALLLRGDGKWSHDMGRETPGSASLVVVDDIAPMIKFADNGRAVIRNHWKKATP